MTIVVFEDERWGWFAPLSLTHHLSELTWGTKTLLQAVRSLVPGEEVVLWGRSTLREAVRERIGIDYNTSPKGRVLLVNARARPTRALGQVMGGEKAGFAVIADGELVVARTGLGGVVPGEMSTRRLHSLAKPLDRRELGPGFLFKGPWDMVESNGMAIAEQGERLANQAPAPGGIELKGPPLSLRMADSAEVGKFVSIDTRPGPVILDESSVVESYSMITGPCYIGPRSRLRSALIRSGTSIFENCRIGGEVENSIIMPFTNKTHFGFVGDSILGSWVNIGAGGTFSNLKNTYGTVRLQKDGKKVDTGLVKFGPVVGDMAKVSIGALVYAGKTLGVASQVTGLVDSNVPSFTYKGGEGTELVELQLDSVLETQRRMMERRGQELSREEEALVRSVFAATAQERRAAGVRKGTL